MAERAKEDMDDIRKMLDMLNKFDFTSSNPDIFLHEALFSNFEQLNFAGEGERTQVTDDEERFGNRNKRKRELCISET